MRRSALRLPNAHRVQKQLSGGRWAIYWYRCRGGEQLIRFVGESLQAVLAAEVSGAAALAAAYAARPASPAAVMTFGELVLKYRVSPSGFMKLAESTKHHWKRSLDLINADFGDLPIKALEAREMRKTFVSWRDSFSETARTADYHMGVLKRVLSWAVAEGEITVDPAKGIPSIHRSNRADLTVSEDDLEALLALVTPHAARAIRFAAETGIRREDLVKLRWEHVHDGYVQFETGKSRGRKRVVVPLVPAALEIVEEARSERERIISSNYVPPANVFLTPGRRAWKPDSLSNAFRRAAVQLGLSRTLNDLRGTAITRFVMAGLSDEQIADIVGWEPNRVRNIRKHYVDPATVARGIAAQLEAARKTG